MTFVMLIDLRVLECVPGHADKFSNGTAVSSAGLVVGGSAFSFFLHFFGE